MSPPHALDSEEDARRWVPEHPAWWQREVIYQIYPRSFFDSSGDGIGDLAYISERLPPGSRTLMTTACTKVRNKANTPGVALGPFEGVIVSV